MARKKSRNRNVSGGMIETLAAGTPGIPSVDLHSQTSGFPKTNWPTHIGLGVSKRSQAMAAHMLAKNAKNRIKTRAPRRKSSSVGLRKSGMGSMPGLVVRRGR